MPEKVLADLQFVLNPVARPNPVVIAWRWRYGARPRRSRAAQLDRSEQAAQPAWDARDRRRARVRHGRPGPRPGGMSSPAHGASSRHTG